MTLEHRGAYICLAKNAAGEDRRRIVLDVECKYLLFITSVTLEHRGAYICIAKNAAGEDRRRIVLDVECK